MGKSIMKEKDGIELKLNGWMTQKAYADTHKIRQVLVGQWVHRAKASGSKGHREIEYLDVPDLGLTLVRGRK
jgi:hypothetical protein